MSKDSPYPYSQYDFIEETYHYMYTPYEGTDLLRGYFESRPGGKLIHLNLFEWYDQLKGILPSKTDKDEYFPISTQVFLKNGIEFLLRNQAEEAIRMLQPFLKRYEVKKFLQPFYNEKIIKGKGDKKKLYLYLMLHRACLEIYEEKYNLKFFNTALKLGDLLSFELSQQNALSTAFIYLCQVSLTHESELVKKLVHSRRIAL